LVKKSLHPQRVTKVLGKLVEDYSAQQEDLSLALL
jgi:hypothetical protein